ncbi:hypothetical protein [Phenylobacterium sp.]|jgi:uncharacterized protein YceK|uniref:hypothetical protein n=1 Tax=Phenylobacterium sp. TaxID=1871053 RepID=UPI002F9557BB
MIRTLCLVLAIGAPLAACNSTTSAKTGQPTATHKAVSAVVVDEEKRAEAAQTAESTGSSAAGVASVTEGPKDQKPVP